MKDLPQYKLKEIKEEKAKRNFFEFVKYTKRDYLEGWFNKLIASELQQFYIDVKAGKQPRLMIFAPPRSGKSELFSRRFPAWALGKDPNLQVIATSYSSDLSSGMNRDVQRIMDDESYISVFPDTRLNSKNIVTVSGTPRKNSEIFDIVGHQGTYRSAGVGAGITGMGADIAIIDDPIKDAKEASSPTIRNNIWDWYTSTLYTRLSPNSGILLGMTRWHEDDLAGRLIAEMQKGEGDQWKIIKFPAIAEHNEEFRKEGEPLQPERFTLERLNKIKSTVGSYYWNSMYQQNPHSLGGEIISPSWFKRYNVLPKLLWRAVYADTAQKTKERNDYTVFTHAGLGVDGNIYILDIVRKKFDAVDLEITAKDLYNKWKNADRSTLRYFAIEDKVSGTGLIQQLTKTHKIPVKAIQRLNDKYTRVLDVQGFIKSGYVYLPEVAHWIADFTDECEKFTANDTHLHDDQVDTVTDCITDMKLGGATVWDTL